MSTSEDDIKRRILEMSVFTKPHVDIVTDEELNGWFDDDGSMAIDLSPDQINRILSQMFLMPQKTLTPSCLKAINTILSLPTPEDSDPLQTFKENYPCLLENMLLATLILQDEYFNETPLGQMALNWNSEYYLLASLLRAPSISLEHKNHLWDKVRSKLTILIKHSTQLVELFVDLSGLSMEELTADQRAEIWAAVEGRLGTLIRSGSDLTLFLMKELTADQRDQIWTAVKGRLETLIRSGKELSALSHLSMEQLPASQRDEIWAAVEKQLGTFIPNGYELADLFRLSMEQLTAVQRAQIWRAVEGQLGTLIHNGHELTKLLELPTEKLTQAQRVQIWKAVEAQLGTLIHGSDELLDLFSLPMEKLTADQRIQINAAISSDSERAEMTTIPVSASSGSFLVAASLRRQLIDELRTYIRSQAEKTSLLTFFKDSSPHNINVLLANILLDNLLKTNEPIQSIFEKRDTLIKEACPHIKEATTTISPELQAIINQGLRTDINPMEKGYGVPFL